MELIRPALAGTAMAVTAAGLVITGPAAGVPLEPAGPNVELTAFSADAELPDPFGVMAEVLSRGQAQISDSITFLTEGDLAAAADAMAVGMANLLIYAPVASFLTTVDAAVGQDPVWLNLYEGYLAQFDDLAGLFGRVQYLLTEAASSITDGFKDLSQGVINDGLAEVFYGVTNIFPDIPLTLLITPAVLLDGALGF